MSDIKVGEYVRTKYGEIGIITENYPRLKWKKKKASIYLEFNLILKHSKSITDLIEAGDIVRYRIDNISTTLESKGCIEGITDIEDDEHLERIKKEKDYHILEILTKESFKANCYVVEEEDKQYEC